MKPERVVFDVSHGSACSRDLDAQEVESTVGMIADLIAVGNSITVTIEKCLIPASYDCDVCKDSGNNGGQWCTCSAGDRWRRIHADR